MRFSQKTNNLFSLIWKALSISESFIFVNYMSVYFIIWREEANIKRPVMFPHITAVTQTQLEGRKPVVCSWGNTCRQVNDLPPTSECVYSPALQKRCSLKSLPCFPARLCPSPSVVTWQQEIKKAEASPRWFYINQWSCSPAGRDESFYCSQTETQRHRRLHHRVFTTRHSSTPWCWQLQILLLIREHHRVLRHRPAQR